MTQRPAPWWYRLAARVSPGRVREIPEPTDPGLVLLRQVALISRKIYIQQIACNENPEWFHHHEGPVLAVGFWGGYTEERLVAGEHEVRAPYLSFMGAEVLHNVRFPLPGHTSILIVLGRERERRYLRRALIPAFVHWKDHVKQQVRRI